MKEVFFSQLCGEVTSIKAIETLFSWGTSGCSFAAALDDSICYPSWDSQQHKFILNIIDVGFGKKCTVERLFPINSAILNHYHALLFIKREKKSSLMLFSFKKKIICKYESTPWECVVFDHDMNTYAIIIDIYGKVDYFDISDGKLLRIREIPFKSIFEESLHLTNRVFSCTRCAYHSNDTYKTAVSGFLNGEVSWACWRSQTLDVVDNSVAMTSLTPVIDLKLVDPFLQSKPLSNSGILDESGATLFEGVVSCIAFFPLKGRLTENPLYYLVGFCSGLIVLLSLAHNDDAVKVLPLSTKNVSVQCITLCNISNHHHFYDIVSILCLLFDLLFFC